MGQRTQLVLKTKDRFGNVNVKVYHEQWGFGKTMPIIILEFICSLNYGSTGQRSYVDPFRQGNIFKMSELNTLPKKEREETLKELQKYSIHNLKLNSRDVTDGYNDLFVIDGKVTRNQELNGVKGIPLLKWDFDILNTENVRCYTGDNNDGLALVSVEEVIDTSQEYMSDRISYVTTVGFLVSDCETIRRNSEIPDTVAINRFHDIYSYCKRYKEYCPTSLLKSIETIYDYFDVVQLGKDNTKKKV